jgi:HD-GYP domain-containing protein (c-di-GMP phosphodiesterase class II)
VSPGARGHFSPGEAKLIEQLASQAVTAVEQSILFAKVRSDAKEIEASYDSTLKALMAALDAKDRVTEGHCERVAKLTIELARSVGVPESQMVHIERGAMLHDVGKIGVPDDILKKPAALTDPEWEAMRKHPLLAGLLVSKVGFLEPALPILLYHHEKYDGSGYPFGLSGENIPLEARIFTIVDAYDAMTQDRPYRDAMSHHAAMEEIREHNGTQFDPDVVTAFERLMASRPELRGNSGRRVLSMDDLEAHDAHEDVA